MSRKIPALTTAAACRYALTGVMAAIASGSQKWNGNCADLVNAATATQTAIAAVNPGSVDHTLWTRAPEIEVAPVRSQMATTAASNASPPTKVTARVRSADEYALRPELAMSANDASDVSSQQMKSRISESVRTRPSIDTVNSVMS